MVGLSNGVNIFYRKKCKANISDVSSWQGIHHVYIITVIGNGL
jgi:hypothetical protein